MPSSEIENDLQKAADVIASANAIMIGAGAGMGVDSGLPDFRGPEGFWKAYPPFQGKHFAEISNPVWFRKDPKQAWGFFGHRYHLYSNTTPHAGFGTILKWCQQRVDSYFVFTSNVDGHFERAGFDTERIVECHGSIHFLQCAARCNLNIWPAEGLQIEVDMETVRTESPLPECPKCVGVARPNILMFGDAGWIEDRSEDQLIRYKDWQDSVRDKKVAILEFGAGVGVPTVRWECEMAHGQLIRVNPRDTEAPKGAIVLPMGALEAINRIDALLA